MGGKKKMCRTKPVDIVPPDKDKDLKHVVEKQFSFPSAKCSDTSSLEMFYFFSLRRAANSAPEQPDVTSHLADSFAPPIF